jgi:zinc/manganese transport system substrate-binding protein
MKSFAILFLSSVLAQAQLKTVTLHPLLTDLVQQVGGDHVTVVDLIGKTGDPHHFEPSADQIKTTSGATLYFVSGKGLESYLTALKNTLGQSAKIIEVGASLPSIEGACDHDHHGDGEHAHDHNIDPHWWHSIENFRRATTVVANELSSAAPAHKATFEKNAASYRAKLEELDRWARKEIAKIPREQRVLATAHDAFGYFCKDHQFTALPVQGINREQAPSTAKLAALLKELQKQKVTALFPEKESNPKILAALTQDSGITLAPPLIADGTNVDTYEQMIRHNVSTIVTALTPKQ